eukprot:COSAG06_NODE_66499_length_254_cov_0.670968_1_plen_40_part_10
MKETKRRQQLLPPSGSCGALPALLLQEDTPLKRLGWNPRS